MTKKMSKADQEIYNILSWIVNGLVAAFMLYMFAAFINGDCPFHVFVRGGFLTGIAWRTALRWLKGGI